MNFLERVKDFFNDFGTHKVMVLATSADNRTTARMMSCIILDNHIFCQTDKEFQKTKQIEINPLVALCADNVQIEGKATLMGSPQDACNKEFTEAFKHYFKGSYDTYSNLANEIVIEISPILITTYYYENGKPCREFYDFNREIVYKEHYEIGK